MIAPSHRNSRNAIIAKAESVRAGHASADEGFRRSPFPSAPHAKTTATKPTAPTAANRTGADAPKYRNVAPKPAPARPPILKAAWNEDMIGARHRRSTTLACAFME